VWESLPATGFAKLCRKAVAPADCVFPHLAVSHLKAGTTSKPVKILDLAAPGQA